MTLPMVFFFLSTALTTACATQPAAGLTFCLIGPTPPAGPDYPWADVRLIIRVPEGQSLLTGFGHIADVRPVHGLMWNYAGDEIPLSGAVSSGVSYDDVPTWKISLTGTLSQKGAAYADDLDADPYFLVTMNIAVPIDGDTMGYGTRDEPNNAWGVITGHNFLTPESLHSIGDDDHIAGAYVWSVPCD